MAATTPSLNGSSSSLNSSLRTRRLFIEANVANLRENFTKEEDDSVTVVKRTRVTRIRRLTPKGSKPAAAPHEPSEESQSSGDDAETLPLPRPPFFSPRVQSELANLVERADAL
eukprot:c34842_g1_i1.p3 GENE.c34842_g1_i1~~c34842_g1_i1.p3  ORF type:complete len:125 (-),score=24.04 c34842_g1_i1:425-766(-)